jgi:PAS domain S-box-containing protein
MLRRLWKMDAMTEQARRFAVVGLIMSIVVALHLGWIVPQGPALLPTTLLLVGIFASATYGGLWPGLSATAVSVIVALLSSRRSSGADDSVAIALLAVGGMAASWMAQAAREARVRADADRAALRRQMAERAATELRLASSEQRLRTIVEALPDSVFVADPEGRLRLLTARWLDCPPVQEDTEPQDLFALVHGDHVARARQAWNEAVAARAPVELRCRLRARDQGYRWTLARAQISAVAGANEERWFGVLIDIDKALAAERALRAADERLRLALDATELGLWDYDFATDKAVCSDRVCSIAGLPQTPINRAVWLALVVQEDLPPLLEHARTAARPRLDPAEPDRGRLDIEYRLRRASDGVIRWVSLTGRVIFDGVPPKPVRATGTLRDITRHREAVERLRLSEERLVLAQVAGHIGMFDWDLASGSFACSATEERLLGLAPRDHKAIEALILPADRETVQAALRDALDHENAYANQFRIVRPDGELRWISAHATITRAPDGTALRMVGVHRDVTDDKEAAQRLEASEERFRLATEALDGLIYDSDPVENRVERSSGLYAVTGFHVDEVPATGTWWRSRIHEADLARIDAAIEKAVAEQAVRIDQVYRVRHREGHWVHVNDRALLVWRNGIACRRVGIVTDVTERRRIERVLHDADRRKDEFLAVLAHELRNPLAPIRNAVQVITRAPEPEVVASAAAILERQVSQMVRLIDDLLDVSRIAQGKLKLRRQATPLASIIEAAVETVQPLLQAKRHAFEYTPPGAGVMIEADSVRLSQVIANLLHNACKYTLPGGRITLEAQVRPRSRTIEIRVTDNGIGIGPQSLENVFTMFSQLPHKDETAETASGLHEGLGIGLALARAVVSLHGGTIHATSEGVDRGSEFVLRLPLSDAAKETQTAPTARRSQEPWRVLVVDDNRDSAESLAALLRLDRHEVLVAYGGKEALLVAEREQPDLILLDIGMPDMDGYEVARLLRADDQSPGVLIVAISGYGQAGDRQKSLAAGFDGHLVKPVAASDLAPWLNRDPAQQALREPPDL